MSIDWFTVGAQILNFFILVWLLKRFLYKPIRNAIDTREKRIEAELADADAKKAEAKAERDTFIKKNEDFDREYTEQLNKVRDKVKAERERLLNEARIQADAMSAKRQELLTKEAQTLDKGLSLRTQQEVFAIARKTLADLGTASLEERLCDVFIRRLRALKGKAKEDIANALLTAEEPALLRTAFDLPEKQHGIIKSALNETFEDDIHLVFVTAPDLISGIELTANGYKIAWSIADYLASMENGLDEVLPKKDETKIHSKDAAATEKSE